MTKTIAFVALLAGCPAQQVPPDAADAGAQAEGAASAVIEAPPEAASGIAERGDDAERKSKNGHLVHTVDGVAMDVRFGRPQIRDRELWGALVPYDKVWRTGADEATTVSFDGDVTVQGKPLPAGVYSLFTVPGVSEWTVIFNKTAKQWGAYDYDAAQDALRVTATPGTAEPVEAFDIQPADHGFVMRWGKLAVPVTVKAAASAAPAPSAADGK